MSAGVFIAVGAASNIRGSPDGVTWTDRTSPAATWNGVAYSPELGLFVAVGNSGAIATSPEGTTWTSRTSDTTEHLFGVCWSPERGIFVGVGFNGYILTSPDGITWTTRTTTGGTCYAVVWSPEVGRFVAARTSGFVRISPDGITWTTHDIGHGTGITTRGVAWSPELALFIAVGSSGAVSTSPNGETWTARSGPTGTLAKSAWSSVLGLFAVPTTTSADTLWSSPDGITWTSRGPTGGWASIGWSPALARFVAVGTDGGVLTSDDGVTWTSRTSGTTSHFNDVAWAKLNEPPNAPTLTNPVGGAVIDRTVTNRFALTPNDPDPGDTSSALEIRYRPIGAATWTTTGQVVTTNHYHDFAAGTFAAGDHEWQARTWDAQGEVGPWASSEFFTAATPPATPTITDPTSGQTIPTETYPVQWSAPSQDGGYEWRRVADNAGSPDTSVVYDGGTSPSTTARSRSVAFPTNNRWEHVQLRIKDGGLWSERASARVQVSWTSPPAPSVTAVGNDSGGYIAVAVDNPPPVGDEPSVTDNDLYRRDVGDTGEGIRIARGITPGGAYNDYATASRQDVEYRARALGSNGTSSLSAWAG